MSATERCAGGVRVVGSLTVKAERTNRFGFPVSLDVTGKRCVVVGGGFEATDKGRKLAQAGASVLVVAEQIEPALAALIETGEAGAIAWAARGFEPGDLRGAFVVIVTPEERGRVDEVAALTRGEGALLCAIDVPERCDFASPATFSVADVVVALSSGGRAPAVLKRMRADLEGALRTPRVEAFFLAMAALRDRLPTGERSRRLREAVEGFRLDVTVSLPTWFDDGGASSGASSPDERG